MKTIIASVLLALAFPIQAAQPLTEAQIRATVDHCRCVMSGGVCVMETRPSLATKPMMLLGYGVVQPADQNYLVIAGPAMCEAAEKELRADSTSARSMVARSRWRKDWAGPCLIAPTR